jgi:predicted GIY-YIG superfamily endonuclease
MATHYVYRLWDADGALLYVGISKTLVQRLTQHDQSQPWADEVASVTAKRYPNRDKARAAEIEAIQTESPRYNIRDRAKRPDYAQSLAALWDEMDASERASLPEVIDRFLAAWPESWTSPSDRSIRTSFLAAGALMRNGLSPTEALDSIYPERHHRKSRKLSPCPSCGQERATHDDARDRVTREWTAAFTCSPCDTTWTVAYDWVTGRPEVAV